MTRRSADVVAYRSPMPTGPVYPPHNTQGWKLRVSLDGVDIMDVVKADSQEGYVIRRKRDGFGRLIRDGDGLVIVTCRGRVVVTIEGRH